MSAELLQLRLDKERNHVDKPDCSLFRIRKAGDLFLVHERLSVGALNVSKDARRMADKRNRFTSGTRFVLTKTVGKACEATETRQ
jgi:hypothetical protein